MRSWSEGLQKASAPSSLVSCIAINRTAGLRQNPTDVSYHPCLSSSQAAVMESLARTNGTLSFLWPFVPIRRSLITLFFSAPWIETNLSSLPWRTARVCMLMKSRTGRERPIVSRVASQENLQANSMILTSLSKSITTTLSCRVPIPAKPLMFPQRLHQVEYLNIYRSEKERWL